MEPSMPSGRTTYDTSVHGHQEVSNGSSPVAVRRPELEPAPGSVDLPRRRAASKLNRLQPSINRTFDAMALATAVVMLEASLALVAYAVLAWVALNLNDPKHLRLTPRVSEDVWTIVGRMAIPVLLLAPLGALDNGSQLSLSRVFAVAVGLVLLGRACAYALQTRLRARGVFSAPTLIVGAGPLGQKLAKTLEEHPEYGLHVVGFVDSAPPVEVADRVIGSPKDLPATLARYGIERVVVAYGAISGSAMVPVLRACDERYVAVYHVPRFFELGVLPTSTQHEDIWGVPLVRLRRDGLRRSSRYLKRGMDLVISATALLLTGPLLALLALAVRVTSTGPVLFRQVRIGQDGKEIELLKFRTMEVNDDSNVQWSVIGDARLTPIGGFLRKTSLDELPQLVNILRGDMSIVGPRPERPHFVQQFGSELSGYHDRHRMPVGLTGWSQVHGLRGDTSIEERVRLDNYYIENWSPWLDFVIVLRTFGALKTAA
jgi:exopolysaccharide biosynthesis polyprenyl glycosylphosphotransferase